MTIQGVSDTLDQVVRDAIASELIQILETLIINANSKQGGKYFFAGTETLTTPYKATRGIGGDISAVSYIGNREKIEYQIGPGLNVQVNQPGDEVFTDT